MDGPSVKCVPYKTFFVFHQNLMKLGEVLSYIDNYNFTNFHLIQMKNKKKDLITHLTDGPSIKGR